MNKIVFTVIALCLLALPAQAAEVKTYDVGQLKPTDSQLKVAVGEVAPDFELPSITGKKVRLSDYRGKQNVVISFVPAAWTPVCSDQWPGYNIALDMFHELGAEVIGVTVDNVPSLYSWSEAMNTINFPVLSDFWPHGKVADTYGILRSDGVSERAIFIIDKEGIIRYIDVHDINKRPRLDSIIKELQKLQ